MDCVITSRQNITSKKGEEYVIFRGISQDGQTVEAFLTKAQADEFGIQNSAIMTPAQLKALFEKHPVVEIEFNQRGRVQSMKA